MITIRLNYSFIANPVNFVFNFHFNFMLMTVFLYPFVPHIFDFFLTNIFGLHYFSNFIFLFTMAAIFEIIIVFLFV